METESGPTQPKAGSSQKPGRFRTLVNSIRNAKRAKSTEMRQKFTNHRGLDDSHGKDNGNHEINKKRPRTGDSTYAGFDVGDADNIMIARHQILVNGVDEHGRSMRLMVQLDPRAKQDFVTHRGYMRLQSMLDVKTFPLPLESQHTCGGAMYPQGNFKPAEYISLRVRSDEVRLPITQVSLIILPELGPVIDVPALDGIDYVCGPESEKIDIILGHDLIVRLFKELFQQIVNEKAESALQVSFVSLLYDLSRQKPESTYPGKENRN